MVAIRVASVVPARWAVLRLHAAADLVDDVAAVAVVPAAALVAVVVVPFAPSLNDSMC